MTSSQQVGDLGRIGVHAAPMASIHAPTKGATSLASTPCNEQLVGAGASVGPSSLDAMNRPTRRQRPCGTSRPE